MRNVFANEVYARDTPTLVSSLRMCWTEARPSVLGMFILRYAAGVVLVAWHITALGTTRILGGALAWGLATFAAYVFNGIMDVAEDRINGSRRPIARGDLPLATALSVVIGSAISAELIGFILGGQMIWLVSAWLLVGYSYSAPPLYLKRRASTTLMTGFLIGWLSYSAGSAVAGGSLLAGRSLLFAIAMSAWTALVGPMAKDIPDVIGDAAANRHTIATLLSERNICIVMSGTAFALGIGFVVSALVISPTLAWPAIVMCGGAVAVAVTARGLNAAADRSERRKPYRAFMLTQYATHVCLLAVVMAGQLRF